MLVAQLENQDPLNPQDGSEFSAQLAQFSQLEQLMALNDSMDKLATSSAGGTAQKDLMSYIGKQVTGEVDSMQVSNGEVSGGFFNLTGAAEVRVEVLNDDGKVVKTIPMGTKSSGSHLISWDGTDTSGTAVADGTYTYRVLANTGSGYSQIPNEVAGTVDGIAYSNGKAYLVVQGILFDPDKLTSVTNVEDDTTPVDSAMSYLGKTITSNKPILEVDDGVLKGSDLGFHLESGEGATIKIYDPFDNLVRTIEVSEEDTSGGSNSAAWDAVGDNGHQVSDGLYYYKVETASGTGTTPVDEEVTGIRNTNGVQYLVLGESGRLVSVSSITSVTQ
jgi:flagellar basal-body rod modification protein FlgD